MKLCSFWLLGILISNPPISVTGFNLDIDNYFHYDMENYSMFGYSVALHEGKNQNWIIVGAPKASSPNTTDINSGNVYVCNTKQSGKCKVLEFNAKVTDPVDIYYGKYKKTFHGSYNRSNQWLGATVLSAGNNEAVACAPRFVYSYSYVGEEGKEDSELGAVGICYKIDANFKISKVFLPSVAGKNNAKPQYGFCQAGFSAAITTDKKRLILGAPSHYLYSSFISMNLGGKKTDIYSERKSLGTEILYLGYSTVAIKIAENRSGVAVGMPRGEDQYGQVVIYTDKIDGKSPVMPGIITGDRFGSYFGYSLCKLDINGDGLDDLVIGAPMYKNYGDKKKYEHDVGRIYVLLQNQNGKFDHRTIIDGDTDRGRFGLALTSMGDLNSDDYFDFAVGAPYAGNGVIYIYHGSAEGPSLKPSQKIYAKDFTGINLKTFGFSLSGGLDIDGNGYADLAIGAYDSNKVLLLRSRPVVNVTANVNFESKFVALNGKKCEKNGKRFICTNLKFCLSYTGKKVPTSIVMQLDWNLDSKSKMKRMHFPNKVNTTVKLKKDNWQCLEHAVYINETILDEATPFEVKIKYELKPTGSKNVLEPIIDPISTTVVKDSFFIQQNCRSDVCVPNLILTCNHPSTYLVGSKDPLVIEIIIENFGEKAFEPTFYMTFPEDLIYKRIERDEKLTISCSTGLDHAMRCDFVKQLRSNATIKFKINFTTKKYLEGTDIYYKFKLLVNSTNDKYDDKNRTAEFEVEVTVQAALTIEEAAESYQQQKVIYNTAESKAITHAKNETELGPHLVSTWNIKNDGPAPIRRAHVYIGWPYKTLKGELLMYLLNEPYVRGENIECSKTKYANEHNLTLDLELSKKYSFAKTGYNPRDLASNSENITNEIKKLLNISEFEYAYVRCNIGVLAKDDEISIRIRTRLIATTISQISSGKQLNITTRAIAKVIGLPYLEDDDLEQPKYKDIVFSILPTPQVDTFPLGVVIVSSLVGVIILMALVYALYKCGFFKRKRLHREPNDNRQSLILNEDLTDSLEMDDMLKNGYEFLDLEEQIVAEAIIERDLKRGTDRQSLMLHEESITVDSVDLDKI